MNRTKIVFASIILLVGFLASANQALAGGLRINNDATKTQWNTVYLTLTGAKDTVKMAISNTADFAGVGIEPYATEKTWNLPGGYGTSTVYARFFNSLGETTQSVKASILVAPSSIPRSVFGVKQITRLEELVQSAKLGQSGAVITELQKELVLAHFLPADFKANDFYGPTTLAGVHAYQASLPAKIATKKTITSVKKVLGVKIVNIDPLVLGLRVGNTGTKVRTLQTQLVRLDLLPQDYVVDGIYEKNTAAAVRKYVVGRWRI